ncbi:MAG: hypothetical protein K2X81_28455, partial [Candidatus Obscuribacterales bacterium]|nr:hypothetical protein [Candidatus Obscuribacterales bacterium]
NQDNNDRLDHVITSIERNEPVELTGNDLEEFRDFRNEIERDNLDGIGHELADRLKTLSPEKAKAYLEALSATMAEKFGEGHRLKMSGSDLQHVKPGDYFGEKVVNGWESGERGKAIEDLKADYGIEMPYGSSGRQNAENLLNSLNNLTNAADANPYDATKLAASLRDVLSQARSSGLGEEQLRALEDKFNSDRNEKLSITGDTITLGDQSFKMHHIAGNDFVLPANMSEANLQQFKGIINSMVLSRARTGATSLGAAGPEVAKLLNSPNLSALEKEQIRSVLNTALDVKNNGSGQQIKFHPSGDGIEILNKLGSVAWIQGNGERASLTTMLEKSPPDSDSYKEASSKLRTMAKDNPSEFKKLVDGLVADASDSKGSAQAQLRALLTMENNTAVKAAIVDSLGRSENPKATELAQELKRDGLLSDEQIESVSDRDTLESFGLQSLNDAEARAFLDRYKTDAKFKEFADKIKDGDLKSVGTDIANFLKDFKGTPTEKQAILDALNPLVKLRNDGQRLVLNGDQIEVRAGGWRDRLVTAFSSGDAGRAQDDLRALGFANAHTIADPIAFRDAVKSLKDAIASGADKTEQIKALLTQLSPAGLYNPEIVGALAKNGIQVKENGVLTAGDQSLRVIQVNNKPVFLPGNISDRDARTFQALALGLETSPKLHAQYATRMAQLLNSVPPESRQAVSEQLKLAFDKNPALAGTTIESLSDGGIKIISRDNSIVTLNKDGGEYTTADKIKLAFADLQNPAKAADAVKDLAALQKADPAEFKRRIESLTAIAAEMADST